MQPLPDVDRAMRDALIAKKARLEFGATRYGRAVPLFRDTATGEPIHDFDAFVKAHGTAETKLLKRLGTEDSDAGTDSSDSSGTGDVSSSGESATSKALRRCKIADNK